MTEYEDPTEKNEQELNLFSEQVQPEDAPAAPETDVSSASPADAPETSPAPDAVPPAGESVEAGIDAKPVQQQQPCDGDSPVVAPPPPRKQPAVQRPGIVSPRPGRAAYIAPAPASAQKAHKPLPHALQQNQTLGQMLTGIRNARGFSLEEVSFSTRIRMEYLLELESDELLKNLPPVYVSAYVRKLAEVYDLSASDSEILIEKMRVETPEDPEELPEKLVKSVNEGALVNENENKRIRYITIAFFTAIGIVVIAILWLVILVVVHHVRASEPSRDPSAAVGGAVQPAEEPVSQTILLDESELDALIVPETPSISVLKMSKTPGVRDTP